MPGVTIRNAVLDVLLGAARGSQAQAGKIALLSSCTALVPGSGMPADGRPAHRCRIRQCQKRRLEIRAVEGARIAPFNKFLQRSAGAGAQGADRPVPAQAAGFPAGSSPRGVSRVVGRWLGCCRPGDAGAQRPGASGGGCGARPERERSLRAARAHARATLVPGRRPSTPSTQLPAAAGQGTRRRFGCAPAVAAKGSARRC